MTRIMIQCLGCLLLGCGHPGGEPMNADALQDLLRSLKDKDEAVRHKARKALGEIGPEGHAAVPVLVEALKDSNSWVRVCAADTLGNIGPAARAAIPHLVENLRDRDATFEVRNFAGLALPRIGPVAFPSLV